MSISFYLAGKYADRDGSMGARRDQLVDMGFRVTHDWMTHELPGPRTPEVLGDYASHDIQGVQDADVVVVAMDDPAYAYRGTFTELGAAIALGKPILLYACPGPAVWKTNVFFHHPRVYKFNTWSKVIAQLENFTPKPK